MVNTRDNQRYVVEIAGFFWLRLRSTGGLFTFEPM